MPGSNPARGIAFALLATLLFVALDVTAKYLTAHYPVAQVVWARFFFHLAWVTVLVAPNLRRALRTQRPKLQFGRSVLMLCTNATFFLAISQMPLADAAAIMFVNPLIATALAVPLLGEKVGRRRWTAVVVGFIGALVIIRPGSASLEAVALLPLLAAFLFAIYQIATRELALVDDPLTTLFYTALLGAIVTSAVVPFVWVTPDVQGYALMGLAGLSGALGQLALIKAMQFAPVGTIAPFNYTNLLWSVIFGFIVFGDLPDRYTMLGAAIIVASGLYVLHRSQIRARESSTN